MARKTTEHIVAKERERCLLFGMPLKFTVYSITDRKLLIKRGFLNREYDETLLFRITDMRMKNNILQTLIGFGLGTLVVYSKDTTDGELVIKNIRHCRDFYNTLSNMVEKERLRNGVHASELIGNHGGYADENDNGIPDNLEGYDN